jgi:hypothetical protein
MNGKTTVTIAVASHSIEQDSVMVFADGRQWDVIEVHGGTVTVRRRRWWHALRRLWPFHFSGFWHRVWTR